MGVIFAGNWQARRLSQIFYFTVKYAIYTEIHGTRDMPRNNLHYSGKWNYIITGLILLYTYIYTRKREISSRAPGIRKEFGWGSKDPSVFRNDSDETKHSCGNPIIRSIRLPRSFFSRVCLYRPRGGSARVTIPVIRKKYDRKYSLTDCVTNLKVYPERAIPARRELPNVLFAARETRRKERLEKALNPFLARRQFPDRR